MLSAGSRHTLKKVGFPAAAKSEDGQQEFRVTAYRWVILGTFAGIVLNNAVATVGYAAIVPAIVLVYGVPTMAVLVLLALPAIEFVPVSFGVAWLFNHLRTHHVVRLGSSL